METEARRGIPRGGERGRSDSFSYKVNDGTADGNTVTRMITVNPVNDAPVAVADSITVNEGGTVTVLDRGAGQRAGQRHGRGRQRPADGDPGDGPGARQPDAEPGRDVQLHA